MADSKESNRNIKLAYIKYLDGVNRGVMDIIKTDQILGRYTSDSSCIFDKTKRYKLKDPTKLPENSPRIQLLCIAENKDDLKKQIDTIRIPSCKNLVSASEESDTQETARSIASTSSQKSSTNMFKLKQSSEYSKILKARQEEKELQKRKLQGQSDKRKTKSVKLSDHQTASSQFQGNLNDSFPAEDHQGKETHDVTDEPILEQKDLNQEKNETAMILSRQPSSFAQVENETDSFSGGEHEKDKIRFEDINTLLGSVEKKVEPHEPFLDEKESHENVGTNEDDEKHELTGESSTLVKKDNHPESGGRKPRIIDNRCLDSLKQNNLLKKKEKQISELKQELGNVDRKYRNLKNDYKEVKQENKELRDRNLKLQDNISHDIMKLGVLVDQQNKICASSSNIVDPKLKSVPIGFIEQDGSVHMGQNKYLPASINDTVVSSLSPATFVGNLLVAVFGPTTLMKSSLTGRVSNRRIGKIKKNKEQDKENENEHGENDLPQAEKLEKLDPKQLLACQAQMKKYDRTIEIACFREYATKKIAYMKKPKRAKINKKNLRKSEDFEEQEPTNNETGGTDPLQLNSDIETELNSENIFDESWLESSSDDED
ncbi:DNA ligase 1-like [Phymastichus coffea]|uniref:DNA ligase 1-like n=1 Tax=Phymastichus coffea TaxID=108790 RepID=UPI00273BD0F8|nr:DNA ligase 1-like [Phymastichus coffea]